MASTIHIEQALRAKNRRQAASQVRIEAGSLKKRDDRASGLVLRVAGIRGPVRSPVIVLDQQPPTRSQRGDHLIDNLLPLRKMAQDQTCVGDVKGISREVLGYGIMSTHRDVSAARKIPQ